MERINPYYNPKTVGLELLAFEDPEACYDFDTLCFWATPDGRVFSASDSGGSCPTPFESCEGATLDEILPKLERVGSVEQAERMFDAWNKTDYRERPMHPQSERDRLSERVRERLARQGGAV